jgi:hypothetical protein
MATYIPLVCPLKALIRRSKMRDTVLGIENYRHSWNCDGNYGKVGF